MFGFAADIIEHNRSKYLTHEVARHMSGLFESLTNPVFIWSIDNSSVCHLSCRAIPVVYTISRVSFNPRRYIRHNIFVLSTFRRESKRTRKYRNRSFSQKLSVKKNSIRQTLRHSSFQLRVRPVCPPLIPYPPLAHPQTTIFHP